MFVRVTSNHLVVLFLLFSSPAIPPASVADDSTPFPLEKKTIRGDGTPGPYSIGRFIDGTIRIESTSSKTQPQGPDGLAILSRDNLKGTVVFDRALAEGDSVVIVFAVPPSWIRESYRREKPGTRAGAGPPPSYRSQREKIPKPFPGLRFGGSKTFDINVGTDRQAALNQTLRLNISGNLTDDISLNAVISDRNIPITPEGNTRELTELDRVLIELKGKNFRVDMGDIDLRNATGRWLSYSRRLSGARAAVRVGGMEVFGSGATSEGRHMSTTLTPIEGNQGPYRLFTESGRSDISIVPGTERVWINGERLTRGINHDYTVNYSTGEITFTENRIIGSDMRIVCDYDYTSESYRRTFYSAGASGSFLGERLTFGLVFAREADDPDRPVLIDLDENMRKTLSQAGDSPAVFSGIRPAAEDSTGSYDLLDGRLVYNPAGDGGYNATFSWVGEDSGSYRYKGGGIYEYVPPEERLPGSGASYEPVAILPGPESHSIAGLHVSFDPAASVHVESEIAGSSVDRNILSPRDDADNDGGAYDFGFRLTPRISTGLPLKLNLSGNRRSRDGRFRPLDRDRGAEENRGWGLPLVMRPGKEIVTEYSGGVTVDGGALSGSGMNFTGGKIELGGASSSARTGFEGRLALKDRGESNVRYSHIVRGNVPGLPDEIIDRVTGDLRVGIGGFAPEVRYEGERATGRGNFTHGTAYGEIRSSIRTPELFGLRGEVSWLYRKEESKREAWADSSTVRGGGIELSSSNALLGNFRARYARRERLGGGHRNTSDQALIEGSFRPDGTPVRLDLSYRAGRSRETTKRRNFIYTGGDRGSYRWEDLNGDGVRDPEEFIPDEHGSYYLYEETLDDYRPVNVVSFFGKLGTKIPGAFMRSLTGRPVELSSETSWEINEKSAGEASDVFLLRLSRFRKQGTTMAGDARFQEDVTVPVGDGGSLRVRFFRYGSYDAGYVSGAERRKESEESLRLRLPVTEEWDAEFKLARALSARHMETRTAGDFRVASLSGDAGTSFYPGTHTKIGVSVGGGFDTDEATETKARYLILKPSLTYFFSGKGRVEASYAWTSVSITAAGEGTRIPYVMARGRKAGGNHDISVVLDYRLSRRMNIVASYTGRRFADRDFEHFARTQLRAMF